jgi:ATP-dependent Clp protease ATP-binding subunit ClpC
MREIKYEVIQVPFETIGMSVRIMRMDDKKDIESELAIFSKERSLISKSYYEDYILSVYIVNIGQLLYFINSNKNLVSSFDKFRVEVLSKLYDVNPLLNPDGLVIDPFGIIKIDDGETTVDGYPLIENKLWESEQPKGDAVFDDKTLDELVGTEEGPPGGEKDRQELDDHIIKTMAEVKKVKHSHERKWWDRLTMYLIVRKFDKNVIDKVLSLGNYNDEDSYRSFIVTSFVKDIEAVFALIDRFGLLMKFTPQQMLDEMYLLCLAANPGIAYDKIGKKTNTASSSEKRVTQNTDYKALKDISPEKMLGLENELSESVVGQHDAITTIVKAIKRSKIGIKEPACPIGSFLLTGRTGVGKTLLAKVLADSLFKKEADGGFIRIDCSEYSSDHEYAKLIGAPAGYVRSDEGGILTNAILKKPFSVVLFDEVEKASEKVHQLLLQVMDEGILTDNHGEVVSFKDTLILMTSNIGAKDVQAIKGTIGFGDVTKVTDKRKNIVIGKAVKSTFKPEFLNRLTETVYFNNIDRSTCSKIVDLELNKINKYLNNKKIYVHFSKSVKKLILDEGYSDIYGAREIKRTVEKIVSDSLADYLIINEIESDIIFDTKVKNKKIIYTKSKTIVEFVLESAECKDGAGSKKITCSGCSKGR